MALDPIVTLEGVAKTYGSFIALHDTNLSIGAGEFVTLLGPSGCGKTTTLRLIGGFESPNCGTIRIAGEDVTAKPAFRRPVNTVFQDYALFPHMSVLANVTYGLEVRSNRVPRAERHDRAIHALAMVGLADKADRMPGQLSGGQRQRVAMARALVRKPKVLLLDEPLSALDVKLREAMQVELKHLHKQLGITFLMVTHDQQEALVLSDRIIVMKQGRVAQIGSPAALYDRPESAYVADFIGATNLIDGTVSARAGGEAEVRLRDGSVVRGEAIGALAPGDAATAGVRPERLRLAAEGEEGLAATVVDYLFHGGRVKLEVALAGAKRPVFMEMQRTSAAGFSLPERGAGVRVVVAPQDVLVYPAEAA
ncbi:ABC transporter ATP-binding protein [Pseudoxanthobacter sp.]|uniref:ABC transporter ATP-binding protein n=1 Tax=Pseudoxanthobacter sp. TaxID=1925742 RepID=UPI002FE0B88A